LRVVAVHTIARLAQVHEVGQILRRHTDDGTRPGGPSGNSALSRCRLHKLGGAKSDDTPCSRRFVAAGTRRVASKQGGREYQLVACVQGCQNRSHQRTLNPGE
jgi:hypothetical protein